MVNRREWLQMSAAAAALGMQGMGNAYAQSAPALKPGKPYAGQTLNLLSVVAPQFSAHEARLAEFEALTGINVKYQYVPFASTREKLTAELVAKTDQYDILSAMDIWGPSLYNLFEPLNARISDKKINMEERYPRAHLRAAKDGLGKGPNYIGFPIRGHVQLLFYRKDIFKKLGLQPPDTWDEMIQAGKVIQEKTDLSGVALYYGKTGGQNLFIWMNYLWGMGGDLVDEQGNPDFNSKEGIAATQAYLDVLLKHKVAPAASASFNETDAVNSMAQGKSAMVPVWWWRYAGLTDSKTSTLNPDQVGFVSLPSVPNKDNTTYTNTWFYGINRNSKRKDAAMEYLTWLTQPAIERDLLLDKTKNEVVAMQNVNLLNAAVNERFDGMHRSAAKALKGALGVPLFPQWPQFSDLLEATINELATGQGDVKSSLDNAAQRARRIIRS